MGLVRKEIMYLKFSYDFARDGGATAEIPLTADPNDLKAVDKVRVIGAQFVSEIKLASGGAATVTIGDATDPDGYKTDSFAEMSGADDGVGETENLGAYLAAGKMKKVLAANIVPSITVGTAALTAGKGTLYLKVIAE